MRDSTRLWKFILLAVALPLLDCTAKKSSSAPTTGRSQQSPSRATPGKRPRVVADVRKSPPRIYEEEEDTSDAWSSSDSEAESDEWDSYDDEDDEYDQEDWRDTAPARAPAGRRNSEGRPTRPSLDLDFSEDSDDEEQSEEGWDSWDSSSSDDTPAARRRGSDGGRRPRPSAWTGDGARSGGGGGGSRKRGPSGRGARGPVVRYQSRRPAAKRGFAMRMPTVSGAAIASAMKKKLGSAREAVEQAGMLASSTSKKLKREVKLAVSGTWESTLLKATWPDDFPPEDELVSSLVHGVQMFALNKDVTKNSAEHRVLLRKLWAKMSEPDWRTVAKAVYLFHAILRHLPVEDHAVLKIFLGKMSREMDKRTGRRYFDLDVLCDVNTEGASFRSFLDRYGTYVFKRANGFNADFQELDMMRSQGDWEKVVITLEKAQEAIELGVSCLPEEGEEEETELTVLCLGSTAQDIRRLWRMYHSALAWVLEEAESGDLFDDADSDAVAECLGEFKSFYTSRFNEVVSFLGVAEELLHHYRLRVPDLSVPPAHSFDTASGSSSPTAVEIGAGDEDKEGNGYDEGEEESGGQDDQEERQESEGEYDDEYDDEEGDESYDGQDNENEDEYDGEEGEDTGDSYQDEDDDDDEDGGRCLPGDRPAQPTATPRRAAPPSTAASKKSSLGGGGAFPSGGAPSPSGNSGGSGKGASRGGVSSGASATGTTDSTGSVLEPTASRKSKANRGGERGAKGADALRTAAAKEPRGREKRDKEAVDDLVE